MKEELQKKDSTDPNLKMVFQSDTDFWVPIMTNDEKTGHTKRMGEVKLSVQVIPKADAEKNKVGHARTEPNINPFLPPPVGRLSLSLNPFKMLGQLVGPAFKRKLYCYCCLTICCALLVLLAPMVLSNIIAGWFT